MNYKLLFFASFLAAVLFSCKKDENRVYFEGGTKPVLKAVTNSGTSTLNMSFATRDEEALRLSWNNPEYQFNTGVSSQNVTYILEVDKVGNNFASPKKKSISITNNLSYSFTQNEINDIMLNQMELAVGQAHQIQMRVRASLNNSAKTELISDAVNFTATPYKIPPKVEPPSTGTLFIVGNATPGGWTNPVPVPAQQFTKVSETLYEITLPLVGGNFYLFLPENGVWSKYGAMGGNGSNNPDGDDFKKEGGDMVAPGASGTYKIVVDFQRGKFTLTKQ
jgi:hypothetical protein